MADIQSTKDSDLSDAEQNAILNFKPSFDHATMETLERGATAKGIGQLRRVTLAVLTMDAARL